MQNSRWVKLQPYRLHFVSLRKIQKLNMHYFGPFKILARIDENAYKLKLSDSAKIHLVFHLSLLKAFKGNPSQTYLPLCYGISKCTKSHN